MFALANNGDEQIDRLIVVPHYRMVGSGLFWPDLGLSRIVTITPSSGDRPERQDSATADVFRITLDPGTVITFVAELRTDKLPQLYLWEPDAYKDKVNSLHALLRHRHRHRRPAGAVPHHPVRGQGQRDVPGRRRARLGGAGLYRHRLRLLGQGVRHVGRAPSASGAPAARRSWPATLLVFLFAYLNLDRWHVRYAHITLGWLAGLAALVAVALFDPVDRLRHRAHVAGRHRGARASALVIYLSTHGFDRAVLLIPTWLLLVVWTVAAGACRSPASSPTTSSARRCSAAWC